MSWSAPTLLETFETVGGTPCRSDRRILRVDLAIRQLRTIDHRTAQGRRRPIRGVQFDERGLDNVS